MKKIDSNVYEADYSNVIVRKADNFTMGIDVCLGEEDSIDNYTERKATEEEIAKWWKGEKIEE